MALCSVDCYRNATGGAKPHRHAEDTTWLQAAEGLGILLFTMWIVLRVGWLLAFGLPAE